MAALKVDELPLLPPLDVSSSSFQLPYLNIDASNWVGLTVLVRFAI